MNKVVVILIVSLLVCMGAQAQPAGAKRDTAEENFQRRIKEFNDMLNSTTADGPVMKIGDKKDGGTVYWVDASGKHGLIAWPSDLGIKKWDEADQACRNLGTGWRMPTKDELDKLYKANVTLQLLSSYFFFHSSTEESPGVVWKQSMSSGAVKTGYKTGTASTAAVKGF